MHGLSIWNCSLPPVSVDSPTSESTLVPFFPPVFGTIMDPNGTINLAAEVCLNLSHGRHRQPERQLLMNDGTYHLTHYPNRTPTWTPNSLRASTVSCKFRRDRLTPGFESSSP